MMVHFHLHYTTTPGQYLVLCGDSSQTGLSDVAKAPIMQYHQGGHWVLTLEHSPCTALSYSYFLLDQHGIARAECGEPHRLTLPEGIAYCTVFDNWQAEPDSPLFVASAFSDSLLAVRPSSTIDQRSQEGLDASPNAINGSGNTVVNSLVIDASQVGGCIIKVFTPMVRPHQSVAVSGDIEVLGNWNPEKALPMFPGVYPEWQVQLPSNTLPLSFRFKFVLTDKKTGQVCAWEWGEPRVIILKSQSDNHLQVEAGMNFRYQEAPWKGTGLAIPLFALRSKTSWGCGDFGDLNRLITWVSQTGQQLIQLLPINDTTLTNTWEDSYPYNAISVHALHPIYVCPGMLPDLQDKALQTTLSSRGKSLNALSDMDYDATRALKDTYLRALYRETGKECRASQAYRTFLDENRDWLDPFAAFCYLRDTQNKLEFTQWGDYALGTPSVIAALCDSGNPWHDEIDFYRVVQFWLHRQLKEARDEAHRQRVVLKGDIPIGVHRLGVDAWHQPHLFNASVQVGAPPDEFSITGQNWGFPSYNWKQMAEDGYRWWKRRFTHLATYFDAYRIDHILGFFRIWEIPDQAVRGLLGQFNPALPLSVIEIIEKGFNFSETLLVPTFSDEDIQAWFGEHADFVRKNCLKKAQGGLLILKTGCDTQLKMLHWLKAHPTAPDVKDSLLALCEEVLFLPDNNAPHLYHPRIHAQQSRRFQHLSAEQQALFIDIHDDFFYRRHDNFWKQSAYDKLSPLVRATRMLACGEDLGMIPACVPEVMRQLQVLSLEIQRMPKQLGLRFENLNAIPYLSVCTTSTHDMNPLRSWWLENKETTTQYYQQILWKPGVTPIECTPEIAKEIILQHLASPAMWVVIPWQDWMAIDAVVRRHHPEEERINIPANPRHYWRYRMHLTLENLLSNDFLTQTIREMIVRTGR